MARPLDLPYEPASRCARRYAWFEAMRGMGWAIFLDSGDPARAGERYDVLAAAPRAVLTATDAPFAAMRRMIAGERNVSSSGEWPLSGGLMGYLGYEAGQAGRNRGLMPAVAMGLYPWTVVVDHR